MKLKQLGELDRTNLADEIATNLRELIISGELTPGTRIIEAEVASQLGVSRGPLREALRILETEGLLESIPGRGSFVIQTSKRDIQELYSLRCILEEEAMEIADHILLRNVLESITIQVRMYLAVQTQLYEDLPDGVFDHQLILQALRNSEKDTAVQLLKDHLELAAQVVLDYFEGSQSQPHEL
jgi:DNA-binding GntR family transcriptional regulator